MLLGQETNTEEIVLEGEFKKKQNSTGLLGTSKWVKRYFQLSTKHLTEFLEPPTPIEESNLSGNQESPDSEKKSRSWPLNTVGVVAHPQNSDVGGFFNNRKNELNSVKVVFLDGQSLLLMADTQLQAQAWVGRFEELKIKQREEYSMLQSQKRIVDEMEDCLPGHLDSVVKDNIQNRLGEKYYKKLLPPLSLADEHVRTPTGQASGQVFQSGIQSKNTQTPMRKSKSFGFLKRPRKADNPVERPLSPPRDTDFSTFNSPNIFVEKLRSMDSSSPTSSVRQELTPTSGGSCTTLMYEQDLTPNNERRVSNMALMSENLSGFLKASSAFEELQKQSARTDKEIEEHKLKTHDLMQKLDAYEKDIEEMKNQVEQSQLLEKEKELIEREVRLDLERQKLQKSQLKTINMNDQYKQTQAEQQKLETENQNKLIVQQKKQKYIEKMEEEIKRDSKKITDRDTTMSREGKQLRTKILEYNQRVVQLNRQATVLEKAEKKARFNADELERQRRDVQKKIVLEETRATEKAEKEEAKKESIEPLIEDDEEETVIKKDK